MSPAAKRDAMLEALFEAVHQTPECTRAALRQAFLRFEREPTYQNGKHDMRLVYELMGHIGTAAGVKPTRERPQDCTGYATMDDWLASKL